MTISLRMYPACAIVAAMINIFGASGAAAQTAVENLQLAPAAEQRQPITGWGIFTYSHSVAWGSYYNLSNTVQGVDQVAGQMFALDINTLRIELTPESYNPDNGSIQPQAIADINDAVNRARTGNGTLATARPVDYLLTVWSPPQQMKTACVLGVVNDYPSVITNECFPDKGFEEGRLRIAGGQAYNLYGTDPIYQQPVDIIGLSDGYYFSAMAHDGKGTAPFIKYLLDALKGLAQSPAGLPYAISLQNEPGHLADYDATYYSASGYKATARALKQALLATKNTSNDLSGVKIMFGDVNAPHYLTGPQLDLGASLEKLDVGNADLLGVHTYDQYQNGDERLINQAQGSAALWANQADPQRMKPLWMVEWSIDSQLSADTQPIDAALYEVGHMLRDLRVYPIERYIWWRAWSYNNGEQSGDLFSNNYGSHSGELITWQPRKIFHVLKRLFAEVPAAGGYNVRPLSYATGQSGDLSVNDLPASFRTDALAFASGERVVLVMANPSSSIEKSVIINGVNGSSAKQYVIDAANNGDLSPHAPQFDTTGKLLFNMVASSINIVVIEGADGGGGGGESCQAIAVTGGSTDLSVAPGRRASSQLTTGTTVDSITDITSQLPGNIGSVSARTTNTGLSVNVRVKSRAGKSAGMRYPYSITVTGSDCSTPVKIEGSVTIEAGR